MCCFYIEWDDYQYKEGKLRLRFSSISNVEWWMLSNVSANTLVAVSRFMYWLINQPTNLKD
jgi:hypothetical protein